MPWTRRDFIARTAAGAFAVGLPDPFSSPAPSGYDRYPGAGDPALKVLAAAALDAARAAGASYADVRFTVTRRELLTGGGPVRDEEHGAVGVRVLTAGTWGFAASPLWTTDEVVRLAREAVIIARANASSQNQPVALGPPPPIATGEWRTPIQRDPFRVPLPEKMAVIEGYTEMLRRMALNAKPEVDLSAFMQVIHRRQEKTFASSDGAFTTQTLYASFPQFILYATWNRGNAARASDLLQPRAGGWEVVSDAPLVAEIPILVEETLLRARRGAVPIQPGRYDILIDGLMVGGILARTIGVAAEVDRALGDEANAGGTTYLMPPEALVGTFALGPSRLNIRGDRTRPAGLASVRWDDDGVGPEDYQVVRDGVLVDYHTTREFASTLASWYARSGRGATSHGCAGSENALGIPLVQPPNLELVPDPMGASFDDLVAGMAHGLVIRDGRVNFDRQQLNGELDGAIVYEVRNGKRTDFLSGSECLVRAPELWKSVLAVGNASTQLWTDAHTDKGEPGQSLPFSVGAPAVLFKQVAVTDRLRKA